MSADKPTWLGYADADLCSAKTLLGTSNAPWHLIAYLSQQSAEKSLKAFLLWKGWSLRKTHDVAELLDTAQRFDPTLATLARHADFLNGFAQVGRYPLMAIDETSARKALTLAGEVNQEIRTRMGSVIV